MAANSCHLPGAEPLWYGPQHASASWWPPRSPVMTRPRPNFTPTPRVWSDFQVACRLGKSESWLATHRPRLEAEGFPQRDPLLGGTDADTVETWLDQRSGLADAREEVLSDQAADPLMEALNDREA